jgi:hypothetical protein
MQNVLTRLLAVAAFVLTTHGNINNINGADVLPATSSSNTGFAVVELFTSEGCSSCPPADDALAHLQEEKKPNVYVLGFHVDYWNSLGWKDVYSNAAYSARQQEYGNVFGLNSVYTPQAVVNGTEQFTGSDGRRLNNEVDEALKKPAPATLQVAAAVTGNNAVSVSYTQRGGGTLLNIALVQLHARSNVRRGENAGSVLSHVNVVRVFKTVNAGNVTGTISLQIPAGLMAAECHVIAYTEGPNKKIVAAAETEIQ